MQNILVEAVEIQNILDQGRRNPNILYLKRPNAKDFNRACRNAKSFACACADSNPEIPDCRPTAFVTDYPLIITAPDSRQPDSRLPLILGCP
jgi:hypothetical protein